MSLQKIWLAFTSSTLVMAHENVYHMNETNLFYHAQPNKALSARQILRAQNSKEPSHSCSCCEHAITNWNMWLFTNVYAQDALEGGCQQIICGGLLPKSNVKTLMKNTHQNTIKYLAYLVLNKRKLNNKQTPPPLPQRTPEWGITHLSCIMDNVINIRLTCSHSC